MPLLSRLEFTDCDKPFINLLFLYIDCITAKWNIETQKACNGYDFLTKALHKEHLILLSQILNLNSSKKLRSEKDVKSASEVNSSSDKSRRILQLSVKKIKY